MLSYVTIGDDGRSSELGVRGEPVLRGRGSSHIVSRTCWECQQVDGEHLWSVT